MGSKIFSGNIPKKCEYCQHGSILEFSGEVVCVKKGVMNKNDFCARFQYDCFKRIPNRIDITETYHPEDLKI